MRKAGLAAAALGFALFACACASAYTKVVDVQKTAGASAAPLKKILVVALASDPGNRKLMEDRIIAEMERQGATAQASYSVIGDKTPTKEMLLPAVRDGGFDGVLVLMLANVEAQHDYVRGEGWTGASYMDSAFYSSYGSMVEAVWAPGYIGEQVDVRMDASLWSTANNGVKIWSATAEVKHPSSVQNLAERGVPPVINRMAADKMF